ncbi:MAG: thiamine phosphate synthase, partial [Cetobacterium sp.]
IFETSTKKDAGNALTLKLLEEINENISIGYTAIGGIKESNLEEVLCTGAHSVCLISELILSENIYETTKRIHNKILNYKKE